MRRSWIASTAFQASRLRWSSAVDCGRAAMVLQCRLAIRASDSLRVVAPGGAGDCWAPPTNLAARSSSAQATHTAQKPRMRRVKTA